MLWDIDGTLVHTAGHGREAFAEAFEAVFGRPADGEPVPMAGRTDHAIALDVMERGGVAGGEEHLPAMFDALHESLAARRAAIAADGHAMPGVPELLRALSGRDELTQSLLTGNIEVNAEVKLAAFGLTDHLDMEIGGYGSDHGTRSELVGVVLRKARERRGMAAAPADVVVVGDTPLDVAAAHAAGARAVAVATGPYGLEQLEQAGPEAALSDLSDTAAALAVISAI